MTVQFTWIMRLEPWTNNLTQLCVKLVQKDALSSNLDNKSSYSWNLYGKSVLDQIFTAAFLSCRLFTNFLVYVFIKALYIPYKGLWFLFFYATNNITQLSYVWFFNCYKNKANVKIHKISLKRLFFQSLLSWTFQKLHLFNF